MYPTMKESNCLYKNEMGGHKKNNVAILDLNENTLEFVPFG